MSAGHSFREYDEAKRLYSAIEKHLSFEYKNITEYWIKYIAKKHIEFERIHPFRDGDTYRKEITAEQIKNRIRISS